MFPGRTPRDLYAKFLAYRTYMQHKDKIGYVMEEEGEVDADGRKCDGGAGSAAAAGAGDGSCGSGGVLGIMAFTMGTRSFFSPYFAYSSFQGSSRNDGSKNARGPRPCGVPRA